MKGEDMSNSASGSGSGGYGSGGGPIYILYMATVQDAIKRGNKDELKKLLDQARQTAKEQGDLNQAIRDLESALK
jgi:uncharacterized protein DUF1843